MADAAVARRRRVGMLSSSEKITGAKNAQADALLQQLLQRFEVDSRKSTAELHSLCECVSHDLRMLSLEQRLSELDARRRHDPTADYSHEYGAVVSMRKHLGLGSAVATLSAGTSVDTVGVAYAGRQQAHRIRRLARPESRSPAVTQAQAAIRRRAVERAVHERRQRRQQQQQQQQQRAKSSGNAAATPARKQARAGTPGFMVTGSKGNWGAAEPLQIGSADAGKAGSRDNEATDIGGGSNDDDDDGDDGNSKSLSEREDSKTKITSLADDKATHSSYHLQAGSGDTGNKRKAQLQSRNGTVRLTKPITLTAMKDCWQRVQDRVKAFCSECEQLTRVRREQEWASEMKFTVSSKDRPWAERKARLHPELSGISAAFAPQPSSGPWGPA